MCTIQLPSGCSLESVVRRYRRYFQASWSTEAASSSWLIQRQEYVAGDYISQSGPYLMAGVYEANDKN